MAMRAPTKAKDPLGPIEFIVSLALTLYALGLALVILGRVAGLETSVGTFGDREPCVSVPQTNLMIDGTSHGNQVANLKHGWSMGIPRRFDICTEHMSMGDTLLTSTSTLLDILWTLGFLVLTRRVIRYARRRGLFVSGVARRVSQLGGFIVIGHLCVVAIGSLANAIATSHMVNGYSILSGAFAYSSLSWPILIGGLAVVSFGRIMQQTVPMREEIDATV